MRREAKIQMAVLLPLKNVHVLIYDLPKVWTILIWICMSGINVKEFQVTHAAMENRCQWKKNCFTVQKMRGYLECSETIFPGSIWIIAVQIRIFSGDHHSHWFSNYLTDFSLTRKKIFSRFWLSCFYMTTPTCHVDCISCSVKALYILSLQYP